jgi:hypothetical protein
VAPREFHRDQRIAAFQTWLPAIALFIGALIGAFWFPHQSGPPQKTVTVYHYVTISRPTMLLRAMKTCENFANDEFSPAAAYAQCLASVKATLAP